MERIYRESTGREHRKSRGGSTWNGKVRSGKRIRENGNSFDSGVRAERVWGHCYGARGTLRKCPERREAEENWWEKVNDSRVGLELVRESSYVRVAIEDDRKVQAEEREKRSKRRNREEVSRMSRRTMPSVGLNSCERIRPERPRNPIQRLVWSPGSQFQVGQIGLPEDEGSNPRMALRRYINLLSVYENIPEYFENLVRHRGLK